MNPFLNRRRFPLLVVFAIIFVGGFIAGVAPFILSTSWINGSTFIYPNESWSVNVNITGDLTVQGITYTGNQYGPLWSNGTNTKSLMVAPMGEMSMSNNSVVTLIPAGETWTPVNGTTTFNIDSTFFTMPSNNTLKYHGPYPRMFHVAVTYSIKGVGANDLTRGVVFIMNSSGSYPLLQGQTQLKLSASGDVSSTAIHVAPILRQNDTLGLYIMNENDGDDLIITYMNMFAMGVSMGDDV